VFPISEGLRFVFHIFSFAILSLLLLFGYGKKVSVWKLIAMGARL
jgi:hypothetical protein